MSTYNLALNADPTALTVSLGNVTNLTASVSLAGPQGEDGTQGDPGVGVPTGGTTGQVLAKNSGTDYDTEWVNQTAVSEWGDLTGDITNQTDLTMYVTDYVDNVITPLQYKNMVTVGLSGADYIVDMVNDEVQLQAAADAVAAAGGGVVWLNTLGLATSQKYRIAAAVNIPEGVIFRGAKFAKGGTSGVTIKTAASVTLDSMFTITGASNPTVTGDLLQDTGFYDLTLDGNNTTTNLVKITNGDWTVFENCRLVEATNSVKTVWDSSSDPVGATYPGGIFMNRCIVSCGTGGIGVDLQYQTQCWINNSWFTAKSGSTPIAHINIKCSNKIKLSTIEFNTCPIAIRLQDSATMFTDNIVIADSMFEVGSGNRAWKEERTHASSNKIAAVGNTIGTGVIKDTLVGANNIVLDTATGSMQPLDATLTALAAYNTNGLLTQTATDTFTGRTITGTADQVTVTNGNGVSGNPTLSLPQSINTTSSPSFANQTLTGWQRVGSATTPANTAAGDATVRQLFVGANQTEASISSNGQVMVNATTFQPVYIARTSGDANAQGLRMVKSRGSIAAPRRVQSGDQLGRFMMHGFSAADDVTDATLVAASANEDILTANATEAFTATGRGRSIQIKSIPTGTTTAVQRIDIDGTGNVIINESGVATDFRVESDTDINNIFSQGSTNRVGIGTATPSSKLDVNGTITGTAGVFTGDVTVPDEVYGSGWNGSTEVPTKNAVYDKIESLVLGGGGATNLDALTDVTLTTPQDYDVLLYNAGSTQWENQPLDANIVPYTPTGNLAATEVQSALTELDNEKLAKTGGTITGDLTIEDTGVKGYRLRRSGAGLDFEGSGAEMVVSMWSGAGFTGTQYNQFRMKSDGSSMAFDRSIDMNANNIANAGTISSTNDLTSGYRGKSITQTAHGFVAGDVLRYNGTAYVKAQADTSGNAEVVGIVSASIDANTFALVSNGFVPGLSGLTAGTTYFLSPTTAGALTATEPSTSGQISKPVFIATATTAGYFYNFRGVTVQAGGTDGLTQTSEASNATPTPTGDARENEYFLTALATNPTFAVPSGTAVNGNKLMIRIKDNSTARTLAWNAIYRAVGVTLPTTTVISKTLYVAAKYNSADTKWDVLAVGQEA